jgi:hypothetical protein
MAWHAFKNGGSAPGTFLASHNPPVMEALIAEIGRPLDGSENTPARGPTLEGGDGAVHARDRRVHGAAAARGDCPVAAEQLYDSRRPTTTSRCLSRWWGCAKLACSDLLMKLNGVSARRSIPNE